MARPIKFIQFGEGNFLRAFADYMIDCTNKANLLDAGVCVFNLRKSGSVEKIKKQNFKYNLISRGIENSKVSTKITEINAIVDALNPYEDFEKFINLATLPELRFVISNSTEAGIYFDNKDSASDKPPTSFPAKLTLLLKKRFDFFGGDNSKGLIVLPCELLERNGDALKDCILQYCTLWNFSEEFKTWLEKSCVFCNTLVDRIVSGKPSENETDKTVIALNDPLAVVAEPYMLWAIEAPSFVEDELPFKKCGLNVVFTNNITPFRNRKVMLLNAPHTLLSAIGLQMGINTVFEAVSNQDILQFLQIVMNNELAKTLSLPTEDLQNFSAEVLDRFRNPFLEHFLKSIANNAIAKCSVRVVVPLEKYINDFAKIPHAMAFGLAANIVLAFKDKSLLPTSEKFDELRNCQDLKLFAQLFAKNDFIMGSLANCQSLKTSLCEYVLQIETLGMKNALKEFLNGKTA